MVPRGILRRLRQLRRRERFLRLVWGLARLAAVAGLVILGGCVVDWLYDRIQDTPHQIHVGLLTLTVIAALVAFLFWVLAPQCDWLKDDDLALRVEEKHPTFRDRLISAVQLNRPEADTQGMSQELIGVLTNEAVARADVVSFRRVADHRRLGYALAVLLPVAAVIGGLWAWQPVMARTLLARHFMADVEIPRRTHLEPVKMAQVFPAGEKVKLQIKVTGDGFDEQTEGIVDVSPKGQPRDRYPLTHSHVDPESGATIFIAEVAASTLDFDYIARLADGRMKNAASVKIVARPAVIEHFAWTLLPSFCGLRPNGERYEVTQPRGDVVGISGSTAKIVLATQKPVSIAKIEILGPEKFDPAAAIEDMGPEIVRRTVACMLDEEKKLAVGAFEWKLEETGYRLVVEDEYGFQNVPPPRRSLRIVPEEPPTVVLLKDYFTPGRIGAKDSLDDFYVEGMPIPLGETLRVPYLAEGPYGLGQAWFLYRVLKKAESGNDIVDDEPWRRLPLPEVYGNEKTGPFDPRRGVFENTPPDKGVDFVALPSPDPDRILGRTVGGGRFHFKTAGIPDGKGGVVKLEDGDRIEYCIEVQADKGDTPGRPMAKSETRVQMLGTRESLVQWILNIAQEERRLRELDNKQRTIFSNP
jgi:hypothetical protein